jgi:hypothetical protein
VAHARRAPRAEGGDERRAQGVRVAVGRARVPVDLEAGQQRRRQRGLAARALGDPAGALEGLERGPFVAALALDRREQAERVQVVGATRRASTTCRRARSTSALRASSAAIT